MFQITVRGLPSTEPSFSRARGGGTGYNLAPWVPSTHATALSCSRGLGGQADKLCWCAELGQALECVTPSIKRNTSSTLFNLFLAIQYLIVLKISPLCPLRQRISIHFGVCNKLAIL